ncbi:MAG: hypothetical protein AAFV27_03450 [Pseudomonadota bacterium]
MSAEAGQTAKTPTKTSINGPRVILHAGFAKTGTTTLQMFMVNNRVALEPHVRFYSQKRYVQAADACRRTYKRPRNPYYRLRFAISMLRFLFSVDAKDPRPIVISYEGFAGQMPGVPGFTTFSQAPQLAQTLVRLAKIRFGRHADITLVYTTRAREPWIRSAYFLVLRHRPLTDDFKTFAANLPEAPGFDHQVERVRQAVEPIPVVSERLENLSKARFGPAQIILDLLEVPAPVLDRLNPAKTLNRSVSPALLERMRHWNATIPPGQHLRDMKRKLINRDRKK